MFDFPDTLENPFLTVLRVDRDAIEELKEEDGQLLHAAKGAKLGRTGSMSLGDHFGRNLNKKAKRS